MLRPILISALLVPALCAAGCGSDDTSSTSPSASSASSGGNGAANPAGGNGGQGAAPATGGGGSAAAGGAGSSGGSGGSGPPGEVRIIAIGDTGEGNLDQHCVADAMSQKCLDDGCDAVMLAGDNFYDDGVTSVDDAQWLDKFEMPYDRVGLEGLPFYVVLGNHDYSPPILQQLVGSDGDKQVQIAYSTLPVGTGPGMRHSDKWTLPSQWYDVDVGNKGILHLFGFDTVHSGDFTQGQDQLGDMQNRVATSTAPWKLVFAHHPRFTSGDHQLDNDLLNSLTALVSPSMYQLQQAIYCNADVFLSGHDHNREYIPAGIDASCPNTHFVISGAGAKVRASAAAPVVSSQYYDEAIEGFFYLIVSADKLVIESYDKSADPNACAAAGAAPPAWTTTLTK